MTTRWLTAASRTLITECTDDILSRMRSKKTPAQCRQDLVCLVWLQQLQVTSSKVGPAIIPPSSSVNDPGLYNDDDQSMCTITDERAFAVAGPRA